MSTEHEEARVNDLKTVCVAILRDIPTRNLESLDASLRVLADDVGQDHDRAGLDAAIRECEIASQLQGMMRAFCDLHMPMPMNDAQVTVDDWPILKEACTEAIAERKADAAWVMDLFFELDELEHGTMDRSLHQIVERVGAMSKRMNRR